MTVTAIPFDRLSPAMREYLTSRAGNYDYYTARDLWSDIPSELHHSEDAMMSFLRGNPALGVEPHEVSHIVSEYNGGLDVPENLMLAPKSFNRELGSADMTDQLDYVNQMNEQTVDVLLEADPSLLAEAWETTTLVAGTAVEATAAAEIVAPVEAGLGEIIGEALAEGLVPAIAAAKVGSFVHDNVDSTEVDPVAAGWLGAGGTVLLYSNPVTGPLCWTASGIYAGFKLFQLGAKVVDHLSQNDASKATITVK